MSLTNRILAAMVAGILVGSALNVLVHVAALPDGLRVFIEQGLVGGLFDVVGRIFIASLKLLVVPLVLVSLICGASSLGDSARIGPIAIKTLGLYLATTAVAVSLALLFASIIGPGEHMDMAVAGGFQATPPPPLADVLVDIFPSNPVKAMADGEMLQIIVFALLVGYAISHAGEPGRRIASFFRDMEAVVMKMVEILMALAPYGVFALLAKLFSQLGLGAIVDLAAYFFTVLAVLLFHAFVVYGADAEGAGAPVSAPAVQQDEAGLGVRFQYGLFRRHPADHPEHGGAPYGRTQFGGRFHHPPGRHHQHGWHRHHAGGGHGFYRPGLRGGSHRNRPADGDPYRDPGFHRHCGGPRRRS